MSTSEPRLDADLAEFANRAQAFELRYKGRLEELLGAALKDYAEIDMLANKIG